MALRRARGGQGPPRLPSAATPGGGVLILPVEVHANLPDAGPEASATPLETHARRRPLNPRPPRSLHFSPSTRPGTPYLASVAVVLTETIKLAMCAVAHTIAAARAAPSHGRSAAAEARFQAREVLGKSPPMLVPASLFVAQQVLVIVAASHLDAVTFQICSQSFKIVPTAFFAVWLLGAHLEPHQWASLPVLAAGTIFVTLNGSAPGPAAAAAVAAASPHTNLALGLAASALSGLSSAYAGVHFEKFVKGRASQSLWVRNLQLSVYGAPLALAYALLRDGARIREGGFLQGFDGLAWGVVGLQVRNERMEERRVERVALSLIRSPSTRAPSPSLRLLSVFSISGLRRPHRRSGRQVRGQHPQKLRQRAVGGLNRLGRGPALRPVAILLVPGGRRGGAVVRLHVQRRRAGVARPCRRGGGGVGESAPGFGPGRGHAPAGAARRAARIRVCAGVAVLVLLVVGAAVVSRHTGGGTGSHGEVGAALGRRAGFGAGTLARGAVDASARPATLPGDSDGDVTLSGQQAQPAEGGGGGDGGGGRRAALSVLPAEAPPFADGMTRVWSASPLHRPRGRRWRRAA